MERNPRLGHGGGAASVTDGSIDDGSSITGEDTLSLSGTEVVSTSGDTDQFYEQYSVFTRETAKTFWEMVSYIHVHSLNGTLTDMVMYFMVIFYKVFK